MFFCLVFLSLLLPLSVSLSVSFTHTCTHVHTHTHTHTHIHSSCNMTKWAVVLLRPLQSWFVLISCTEWLEHLCPWWSLSTLKCVPGGGYISCCVCGIITGASPPQTCFVQQVEEIEIKNSLKCSVHFMYSVSKLSFISKRGKARWAACNKWASWSSPMMHVPSLCYWAQKLHVHVGQGTRSKRQWLVIRPAVTFDSILYGWVPLTITGTRGS